jgi:hypothetical protein
MEGMAQMVECLSSEALNLNSNLSTAKEKEKGEEESLMLESQYLGRTEIEKGKDRSHICPNCGARLLTSAFSAVTTASCSALNPLTEERPLQTSPTPI